MRTFPSIAKGLKTSDLKSQILITIALLAICRFIAFARIPGLDGAALEAYFNAKSADEGLLGGDALSIMLYIIAAIVISLLLIALKKYAQPKPYPAR